MKPNIYIRLFFFFIIVVNIHGNEVIWHPLHGEPFADFNPVDRVVQVGSEVVIIAVGPGFVFDPTVNLPSERIFSEFPSLFVSYCIYSLEFPVYIQDGSFHEIYGGSPTDIRGKYNYDRGDGWIFHQKGLSGLTSAEERFGKSLGWMFVQHYPWVYGLDFGWRYVIEAGIAWHANAWWFYEPDFGWFWTTRSIYPVIYHDLNGWIQYENDD